MSHSICASLHLTTRSSDLYPIARRSFLFTSCTANGIESVKIDVREILSVSFLKFDKKYTWQVKHYSFSAELILVRYTLYHKGYPINILKLNKNPPPILEYLQQLHLSLNSFLNLVRKSNYQVPVRC